MGQIIQHHIKVDRIPAWMQQMADNKKVRKAAMLKKLEEWSKSQSQNQ